MNCVAGETLSTPAVDLPVDGVRYPLPGLGSGWCFVGSSVVLTVVAHSGEVKVHD